jgi:surface polysaccharide O-acyltransferase-like enzyme
VNGRRLDEPGFLDVSALFAVVEQKMEKPLTTETQRHRENLFYGFLRVSVPLWLMVFGFCGLNGGAESPSAAPEPGIPG